MAKLGLDGHDRGANVVSAALKDAGFDVTMSGLFASPTRAARFAADERCDVIGISSLAGAHESLVLQFMGELGERDVCAPVVVGGIVPDNDARSLRNMGVAEIFGPGTTVHEIVARLVRLIETSRFGGAARPRRVADLDRERSTVDSGPLHGGPYCLTPGADRPCDGCSDREH
jgi:methylmalonyl-CoA mutase